MLLMTGRILLFSDDMAHGFFAPIIALYIAWDRRDFLLHPVAPPSLWSIGFLGIAAFIGTIAVLGNSSTFSRFAFLISLAGCLLLVGGWQTLGPFLFPLSLLLFTFPVPDVFYGELTQPLQMLATRISESIFEFLGFSVIRDGNILQLTYMRLSVIEACSGLRSLITLFFFCLVYSYFFEPRTWLRAVLVSLAIPSAIAINALRITMTGVLGKYEMKWTEGTYHEVLGWVAFVIGFLLVLACHRAIRRIISPELVTAQ
ncbi:MAG: eight transrane protein EpsH [Bryobacterales bacterium]|nr:eight transrane protein EpsH [Bryobacterales bacterium]